MRSREEVSMALEDGSETAKALTDAATYRELQRGATGGQRSKESKEERERSSCTDVRVVVPAKGLKPLGRKAEERNPIFDLERDGRRWVG